jgi:glycosyltransferase involved in cell wall biosynthesis
MRILMLAQFFRPVVGGEERSVEDLASALAGRGHDVAVATLRVPGAPLREVAGGVRIHRLDGLVGRLDWLFRETERRHLPPVPDPQLVSGLARVLSEEGPDIVHAHNWIVHSFLPLRRRTPVPLVLSLHDYSLVCATKRLIRSGSVCSGPGAAKCLSCAASHYGHLKGPLIAGGLRASAPLLRRGVDMYLPVSRTVAERLGLAERGLPFEVIPNLLPVQEEAPATASEQTLLAGLPEPGFILFLGDATHDKGAVVLREAHRMLEQPPPLVFIGRPIDVGGSDRDRGVLVLGPWPHRAALEAVRRCSMVVAPSIVPETFGIGVLEAMRSGKPVVASRLGGLAELVVDHETGRLVPPDDPAALRGAISALLDDRPALESMGCAAAERARLYSADRVAPRVEHVYRSLLAASPNHVSGNGR